VPPGSFIGFSYDVQLGLLGQLVFPAHFDGEMQKEGLKGSRGIGRGELGYGSRSAMRGMWPVCSLASTMASAVLSASIQIA
jgi:hypothetical protein